MPSADVYGRRELKAVKPIAGVDWLYGFRTNTSSSEATELGQIPATVNGKYITGLVIGANSPRPATMRKDSNTGGTDSSKVSFDAIDTARVAGWSLVSLPTTKRAIHTKDGKKAFVDLRALDEQGNPTGPVIKYLWNLPLFLYNLISADLPALGIELASPNDENLVIAPSFPRPPQARRITINADGSKRVNTTFCDPKKLDNLPAGWTAVSGNF